MRVELGRLFEHEDSKSTKERQVEGSSGWRRGLDHRVVFAGWWGQLLVVGFGEGWRRDLGILRALVLPAVGDLAGGLTCLSFLGVLVVRLKFGLWRLLHGVRWCDGWRLEEGAEHRVEMDMV